LSGKKSGNILLVVSITMQAPRKDILIPLLLLAVITFIMIFSGGCGCNQIFTVENLSLQNYSTITSIPSSGVLEVYHFHETKQCYSCRVLGELAKETMNTSFMQEMDEGKIFFRSVNIQLPENAEIVSRFVPTSSSLMIGYTDEAGFHAENQIQLWYKLGDKIAFGEELSGVIRKRLSTVHA